MKTFNFFVVELKKLINDTIKTDSGLELYIDTRFEMGEFEYRINEGPVVASPFKYNTGVKPGDTLYFHHLVVMQGGQPLTGEDDHYIVKYDPEAINSQAIAFKCQDTGEIKTLGGWTLLEAVEEEEQFPSDLIDMVELEEKLYGKAQMELVAKHRMREVATWSKLKKEFDDGNFDKEDVNTHQANSYMLRLQHQKNTITPGTSQPEVFNVMGQLNTLERVIRDKELQAPKNKKRLK